MLQLREIKKDYKVGDRVVNALRGVTVDFGEREFTAILGSSGCGKTTLMNLVGGLDQATSGDLIIDGVSTQNYKDNDWNDYRNHQIGFVFQAYNLIPHMTVLGNVELALTLSGVSARERRRRAKVALDKVGLSDQIHKKPNQMSGGQMQRVAIARAIVNSPKILLADEPTGAVDTATGYQIMDILKEISQDCLVIMVTHNQELAAQYADRTIRMQDGLIINDSSMQCRPMPFYLQCLQERNLAYQQACFSAPQQPVARKKKKANMSFVTATKLSFNNLLNKKGRSLITVIAGAISVICIALILAMNSGFAFYIDAFERDNLSRFPIRVTTQTTSLMDLLMEAFETGPSFDPSNVSLGSMMDLFRESDELREKFPDADEIFLAKLVLAVFEMAMRGFENMGDDFGDINEENMFDLISEIFGVSLGADIDLFMQALNNPALFNPAWGAVMKNYDLQFNVYTRITETIYNDLGRPIGTRTYDERLNPVDLLIGYIEKNVMGAVEFFVPDLAGEIGRWLYGEEADRMRTMFENNSPWAMMIDDAHLLGTQYDVLAGRLPDFTRVTNERGNSIAGANEIVIVVDEFNQLDDFTLFSLGIISAESFGLTMVNQVLQFMPPQYAPFADLILSMVFPDDTEEVKHEYSFNELLGAEFMLRIPTDYFPKNPTTGLFTYTDQNLDSATPVRVVGILRLKPGVSGGVINGSIGYTEALVADLIYRGNNAPIRDALKAAADASAAQSAMLVNIALRLFAADIDIDALTRAANAHNMGIMTELLPLLDELSISPENMAVLLQIAQLFDDFSLTPENMAVFLEMLDLLFMLDASPESIDTLLQIATLMAGFSLTPENRPIIEEMFDLVLTLSLAEDNWDVLVEIALLLGEIDIDSQNQEALFEIALAISELNLSAQAIDDLIEIALLLDSLQGLTASELGEVADLLIDLFETRDPLVFAQILGIVGGASSGNTAILVQIYTLIDGLPQQDEAAILEIVGLIADLNLSSTDAQALREVLVLMGQLDISAEDRAAVLRLVGLYNDLNMDADDMQTLRAVFGLMGDLDLSPENRAVAIQIIALFDELDMDADDMQTIVAALRLLEDIELTAEERALLLQVLGLVRELDIISEDIEALMALVQAVASLNLTREEIEFLFEIAPKLAGLDFSGTQMEIIGRLGGLFPIRNITMPEDADHPDDPLRRGWYDATAHSILSSRFREIINPVSVDIYPFSIEARNHVLRFIVNFNLAVASGEIFKMLSLDAENYPASIDFSVVFVDELSEMTASMSSMINTITYILIGVAAIAVIVAMLLVAIILYISVQDRTKEIGLLRSLGASKGNVSSVFIAETFIIGLVSGIMGVGLALLLILPANAIIASILGINGLLRAVWWQQILLIGVAFVITVISGLIPAALAAKKDPVKALRSE
jgi:ABC-type lipoprotein export system ATPase subunit